MYRRGRIRDPCLGFDLRVELLQLADLSFRSPTDVAIARFPQVGRRDFLVPARRIEQPCQFVSEGFIVDKAVHMGGANRLLIKGLRVQNASLDPCDLRRNQRGAVLKCLRRVLGPHFELLVNVPPKPRNVSIGLQATQYSMRPREQAQHRGESPRFRTSPLMSNTTVAP